MSNKSQDDTRRDAVAKSFKDRAYKHLVLIYEFNKKYPWYKLENKR